jgi:lipopolysaccharide/colanic/teichoic acid biosynthesis glycosyltransferase
MDFKYIDNWSLGLDIKILFKTVFAIFKGSGI